MTETTTSGAQKGTGSSDAANEAAVTSEGAITDADVARAHAQVGVAAFQRDESWNRIPDSSSLSHFAFGCGDDNPLFHDPDYGRHTRWRGQIAPPTYLVSTGIDETPKPHDPATKALFRGLFRGVGKYFSGVTWTWYQPVYADQAVYRQTWTLDVQVKTSSFSGGRSVIETFRTLYVDRAGQPLATRDESYVNADRSGSKKAGKHAAIERQVWSPEEVDALDEIYGAEQRRGADPRFIEDVQVGDQLGTMAKGPLTTVDVISMHMAMGWGGYGVGPLRYAHQLRQRMPAFFVPDRYGVPDVVQRVHWDSERAADLGLPAPYDYGQMRAAWLGHLLTDWAGDDAWVAAMAVRVKGFNFHGDAHRCEGVVTAIDLERGTVSLELSATNQRGEATTTGTATVLLPSREHGPVVVPVADEALRRRAAAVVAQRTAASNSVADKSNTGHNDTP